LLHPLVDSCQRLLVALHALGDHLAKLMKLLSSQFLGTDEPPVGALVGNAPFETEVANTWKGPPVSSSTRD